MSAVSAAGLGLSVCPACQLLVRASGEAGRCPRCHALLHARKRDSLGRTAAFLGAATVLLVPANLLPVMTTRSLSGAESDTIASGVAALWRAGSWPLAILVFGASVVVPVLKIAALALLVASTAAGARWGRAARTRLYRVIERVGRWSMLDLFVMALLAALVRGPLAGVEIEAGALAFAAVVVLTMLSSLSFDPRLVWDRGGADE
jgi:paraquat-inducible protein A